MRRTNPLPFLFIHGAGGTKNKWRRVDAQVKDGASRVVDLPGRGEQQNVTALTIRDHADFIGETISEDVIVVGHSMGGLVGMELALNNPLVKGLMLVGSHYELPVHPKILTALDQGVFPDGLFYASYRKEVLQALLEEERREIGLVSLKQTYADFLACSEYSSGRDCISKLTIPILAIYGDEDRLLPVKASRELVETNRQVKVVTVEHAGHYIMLEQPQAFEHALIGFRNKIE